MFIREKKKGGVVAPSLEKGAVRWFQKGGRQ